jgi:hypothetical protein
VRAEFTEWLNAELENPENQVIQYWEAGDLLLVDLFSMAHSVLWFSKDPPSARVMQGRVWFEPGVKTVEDNALDVRWVWEIDL